MKKKKKGSLEKGDSNWKSVLKESKETELPAVKRLLKELCATVKEPERSGPGKPPIPERDVLFCMNYKVYHTLSTERCASLLKHALEQGLISTQPSTSALINYFGQERFTPLLEKLIGISSQLLRDYDTSFSIDATPFSKDRYLKYRKRYPNSFTVQRAGGREYINLHCIGGNDTFIITAAIAAPMRQAESWFFAPLLTRTVELGFKGREIWGDKAYGGRGNEEVARRFGFTTYLTRKKNMRNKKEQQEEMKNLPEKRNSIEIVFHKIKSKFSGRLRNHTEIACYNEALCKAICHNLTVLHDYEISEGKMWEINPD